MSMARNKGGIFAIAVVALTMLVFAVSARGALQPVKLFPTSQITNGLAFPEGVATSPTTGDVYVTDRANHRVQEFEANGTFVRMFGKEVNETAHLSHETENEDVCPVKAGDKCKAGVAGTGSGEFGEPQSITVDPVTGNVYVEDFNHWRIEEFTATGKFILMFGKEVNETAHLDHETANENICPSKAGDKCKSGLQAPSGSSEPGAFDFAQFCGNLLATGPNPAEPAEDLLYVGDEHRVQEFKSSGASAGEISLSAVSSQVGSKVRALSVDTAGNVYVVDPVNPGANTNTNTIRKFNTAHKEVQDITVQPAHAGGEVGITGLTLEAAGRMAASVFEAGHGSHGVLLEDSSGEEITEFAIPGTGGSAGIAFTSAADLYVATEVGGVGEVVVYSPRNVAGLVALPVTCQPGSEVDTDVTLSCELTGDVNPEGVAKTEVWFQWGRTCAFGFETLHQSLSPVTGDVLVGAPIEAGVRPNQVFCYRLVGFDEDVQPPEKELTSKPSSGSLFATESVPPRSVGVPSASFVKASSAVMSGEINPENASTEYFFEYGTSAALGGCPKGVRFESCSGVATTATEEAACVTVSGESRCLYGKIGVTLEATGLQPDTEYSYRLNAVNQDGQGAVNESGGAQLGEGAFTTAPAPVPVAVTGNHSSPTSSSAVITGTVNPDGLPATYAFELGVDNGANTQFAIAHSGLAGDGDVPLEEQLEVTGLQAGTTYAYRIRISSGYIENESHIVYGATATFETAGLPAVLAAPPSLPLLAVPSVKFPTAAVAKCKVGYTREKSGKCVKTKRAKGGSKAKKTGKKASRQRAKQSRGRRRHGRGGHARKA